MELVKDAFDLTEDDIRTPVGCETGVDIKLSSFGKATVGLSIECKNAKSLNLWSALSQAIDNTETGCEPAVVFKRGVLGRQETWITVPFDHYLELRRELLMRRRLMAED